MAISKSKASVIEYVSALCSKRQQEVKKEIEHFYVDHLDPVLNEVLQEITGDIPTYAEKLLDLFENNKSAITHTGCIGDYHLNNLMRDLNNFGLNLFSTMRNSARQNIIRKIENPENGAVRYASPELSEVVLHLQKDERLRELLNRLDGIDTLSKELERAVKASISGKHAYNTMVALGVDMSEYKEPQANLPAVTKLSADVCLLNGTC